MQACLLAHRGHGIARAGHHGPQSARIAVRTPDANVIKTFIKGQRQAFKKRLLKAQEEAAAQGSSGTTSVFLSTNESAAQERSQKRRRAGAPRTILNPPPTSTTILSIDLSQQHQHHQIAFDRLLAAELQFREQIDLCEDN